MPAVVFTQIVRPVATLANSLWTPLGAGNLTLHEVLDDVVEEPTVPSADGNHAHFQTAAFPNDAGEFRVQMADAPAIPPGMFISQAALWVYMGSTGINPTMVAIAKHAGGFTSMSASGLGPTAQQWRSSVRNFNTPSQALGNNMTDAGLSDITVEVDSQGFQPPPPDTVDIFAMYIKYSYAYRNPIRAVA